MKKFFTTAAALVCCLLVHAQTTISDSVSLGAGYAEDVYYSTQTYAKTNVPNNNWDLAFHTNAYEVAIWANHINGVTVYQVPNTNSTGFSTLDTTGITGWQVLYNPDTNWSFGALNVNTDPSNPFDYGWGVYNVITHTVSGDSLYVVKLSTPGFPDDYRKLFIQEKTLAGDYIIRYANLDNTNDVTTTIYKTNYIDKNFGYYSLRNNVALDREPLTADWDLLFTRYLADLGGGVHYPSTGVLNNINVQVAEASNVDLNTVDPVNYVNAYTSNISEIGYDWKTFNGTSFVIEDSLCYFINSQNGAISKIVFTGFGGSANGNIYFDLTNYPTAINENNKQLRSMALYPNITSSQTVLAFNNLTAQACELSVIAVNGTVAINTQLQTVAGINQHRVDVSSLAKGIYLVMLNSGTERLVQKLIVE